MPQRWTNKNDALPDTSLEKVFAEFYGLKKGLEDNPGAEAHTDLATIMLVSIVENFFRVKMLSRVGCLKPGKRIGLRVSLLMDVLRGSDRGWTCTDQDLESVVRSALEPIAEDASKDIVYLCVGGVDRFIDMACPRPRPYLKNEILASSYSFQNTGLVKREFGNNVFDDTGYCESDYKGMFNARHALVHSLMREPQPGMGELVSERVRMVESLFRKLLGCTPGVFDCHKGTALIEIDPETALTCLTAAAEQPDPGGWTHYHLGRTYHKMGNAEGAKTAFLVAVRKIGGLRKDMEGRCAQVDYHVSDFLKLDMAVLSISLGEEMRLLGEDDAAVACFDVAVSIAGEEYPDVCTWAAWHHVGVLRYREAIACLDVALRHNGAIAGKLAQVYHDKGSILQLLGQDGEAEKCFGKALELDSANEEACGQFPE